MRLNDFNSLLQEIMDEEDSKKVKKAPLKGKEKFLRESLLRATKDIDRNKLKGAKKIEAYKSAYKEILEGYYPGQAWYNITTANMDNDFANGLTTKEVMTNIVEGLKKPTTKKSTKSTRLTESKKLREGKLSQRILAAVDQILGNGGGRGMEEAVEDDYGWDSYDDNYFDDEYFDDEYSEYDDWEDEDYIDDEFGDNEDVYDVPEPFEEAWTDKADSASNILSKNTSKINNAKTVQELVQIVKDAIPESVAKQPKVATFLKTLPKDKTLQRAMSHVYNFILADKDATIKEGCTGKGCNKDLKEGGVADKIIARVDQLLGKGGLQEDADEWDPDYEGEKTYVDWDKGSRQGARTKGFPAEADASTWQFRKDRALDKVHEGCEGGECGDELDEGAKADKIKATADKFLGKSSGRRRPGKGRITEAVGDKKYGGTVIGDEETTVGAPKKGLTEAGHYDPVTHDWVTGEDATESPKKNPHKDAYDRIMSMSQYEQDPTKVLEQLFDELVPGKGKADTVAGEAVRAMMRLLYRWLNDGDKFFEGYGLETCASPAMWLINSFDKTGNVLRDMLDNAEELSNNDDTYKEHLIDATDTLIEELKSMEDEALAPNEGDCLAEDTTEIQEAAPTFEYDIDVSGEDLETLMEHDIVDWDWVRDTLENIIDSDFSSGTLTQWARDAFAVEDLNKEDYDKACDGFIEKWFNEAVQDMMDENEDILNSDEDEDYEDEEEE